MTREWAEEKNAFNFIFAPYGRWARAMPIIGLTFCPNRARHITQAELQDLYIYIVLLSSVESYKHQRFPKAIARVGVFLP